MKRFLSLFLGSLVMTCPCLAQEQEDFQRILLKDCNEGVQRAAHLSSEERQSHLRYLVLLLQLGLEDKPEAHGEAPKVNQRLSQFYTPYGELGGGVAISKDIEKELEHRRCALQILEVFGSDVLPVLPNLIALAYNQNLLVLDKELQESLFDLVLKVGASSALENLHPLPEDTLRRIASFLTGSERPLAKAVLLEFRKPVLPIIFPLVESPQTQLRDALFQLVMDLDPEGEFIVPAVLRLFQYGDDGLRKRVVSLLSNYQLRYSSVIVTTLIPLVSEVSTEVQDVLIPLLIHCLQSNEGNISLNDNMHSFSVALLFNEDAQKAEIGRLLLERGPELRDSQIKELLTRIHERPGVETKLQLLPLLAKKAYQSKFLRNELLKNLKEDDQEFFLASLRALRSMGFAEGELLAIYNTTQQKLEKEKDVVFRHRASLEIAYNVSELLKLKTGLSLGKAVQGSLEGLLTAPDISLKIGNEVVEPPLELVHTLGEKSQPILLKLLKSGNALGRMRALKGVEVLSWNRESARKLREVILSSIENERPENQDLILQALRSLGGDVERQLLSFIKKEGKNVRFYVRALHEIAPRNVELSRYVNNKWTELACQDKLLLSEDILGGLTPEKIKEVFLCLKSEHQLHSKEEFERFAGLVSEFPQRRDPAFVNGFKEILQNPELPPLLVLHFIQSLSKDQTDLIRSSLLPGLLGKEEVAVRYRALQVMAQTPELFMSEFEGVLKDEQAPDPLRFEALEALVKQGKISEEIKILLSDALTDSRFPWAVRVLKEISVNQGIPLIESLESLEQREVFIRLCEVFPLYGTLVPDHFIPRMLALVADQNEATRHAAFVALVSTRPELSVLPQLFKIILLRDGETHLIKESYNEHARHFFEKQMVEGSYDFIKLGAKKILAH